VAPVLAFQIVGDVMSVDQCSRFAFVIDTERYAGNFERQMCAYVTGALGECKVGRKERGVFREEVKDHGIKDFMMNNIVRCPDDHGVRRPAYVYPTPGWFNNGLGSHHRDGDEKAARAAYDSYVQEEKKNQPDSTFDYGKWKGEKHPAYMSVAIWMSERPSDVILEGDDCEQCPVDGSHVDNCDSDSCIVVKAVIERIKS